MRARIHRKNVLRSTVLGLASVAALAWWYLGDDRPGPAQTPAQAEAQLPSAFAVGNPSPSDLAAAAYSDAVVAALHQRNQQLALWQARAARAKEVYNNYRDVTRYPPESRPLLGHPDQLRPFEPVVDVDAARDAFGKPLKGLRLRTTQTHAFLGGSESTVFTIAALNDQNEPLALVVSNAVAQAIPDTAAPVAPIQTQVRFNDQGADGDAIAMDGTYSARFTPAGQGFAAYAGTARVLAQVSANGQSGVVQFEVVYAPEVPATWLGVREAVEDGSLSFYFKIQAKIPGQYVGSARVFDANDKPLALLQFNNTVAIGPQELKMQLFGALIRDKAPAFPLRLVDVDGFLLRPHSFPDRLMMARQSGVIHSSGSYPVSRFSSAEWSNEERERHLREYGHDKQVAAEQVRSLQGP